MMMLTDVLVIMVVVVVMSAVRAAFGLKRCLQLHELGSKAMEHIFDYVVGPNTKNVVSNLSRQVPVSQMPRKAHELMGIFVSDFHNQFRSSLNLQPPPIFQLQAIAIGHRNGLRKVKQDIFAMIRSQTNTAAMARVKIERQSACRFFLRPMAGGAMDGSIAHCHPQYRK
jgi:hypothetical protein